MAATFLNAVCLSVCFFLQARWPVPVVSASRLESRCILPYKPFNEFTHVVPKSLREREREREKEKEMQD